MSIINVNKISTSGGISTVTVAAGVVSCTGQATFAGELQQRIMTPRHRGFLNLSYKTRNNRWEFDFTTNIYGSFRLPIIMLEDGSITTDNKSQPYPILNAQITHNYKKWEFYLGGENLGNFTQSNPIINAESPFSQSFDATRIWAPVYGINGYIGIRFKIKKAKE